jgi:hypothetical protein
MARPTQDSTATLRRLLLAMVEPATVPSGAMVNLTSTRPASAGSAARRRVEAGLHVEGVILQHPLDLLPLQ